MRALTLGALLLVGCAHQPKPVERITPATAAPTPTPTVTPTPTPIPVTPSPMPTRPVVTSTPSVGGRSRSASTTTTGGAIRTVNSTAYCETGTMASGKRVYWGAVAMNGVPFGSRWLVHDGPMAGSTLVVEDRIGHSSQFEVAMPGNCQAARNYGRRTVRVERVA